MCGFAGYFNLRKTEFSVDDELLNRMQQSIAHRGPDAHQIYKSDEHQLGLAFRRLSIIDLSPSGNQPMFDKQKTVVACFNGEIYNYQEIHRELEGLGYGFFSRSDTETILYAYKEWGIDFVYKLTGMFAITIYDFEKRELYLIRDRIGVKPLYFSLQSDILSFSSEIKALWHLPWVRKEINELAQYHYLTFMVTPAPYTIYKDIYKLPAGFYLKVNSNKNIEFKEWYNPARRTISFAEKKQFESEDFCIENIKNLLIESTKKRMIADLPVGAFLSGGVDSSLNVALMSQYAHSVKTFTVAFSDGPEFNELKWARLVSKKFGTDHHEIVISEKEAFEFFEKMVYHLDEPLADCVCIPFYYVSKLARENGIVVAQVGEGADELFFGYSVYANYKKFYDKFWRPTQIIPYFAKKTAQSIFNPFLKYNPTKSDLLRNWTNGRELFWGGAVAFNETHKNFLYNHPKNTLNFDPVVEKIYPGMRQEFDSFAIVDYHLSTLKQIDPDADFCKQMLYLELKQRLPELLLMRADKMSMAQGIEAREPFLDHKLVEFMLNVPAHLKFKNNTTKYLLKKICRGILPDEIIDRQKVGFAAPTQRWFNHGKYFPAYFAKHNMRSNIELENLYKNSTPGFAVQKWTLQNLWAIKN